MCELDNWVTSEEAKGSSRLMLVSQGKKTVNLNSWQQEDWTEDARSLHTRGEGKWEHGALRTSKHCF